MSEWKRPASVPFPSVWRKFEGKKHVNGVVRKYWVQDVTDDIKEQVIDMMCTDFIKDEALCRFADTLNDPQAIAELRTLYNKCCDEKLALVCLTKNENGETEVVGANITHRSYKGEKHLKWGAESKIRICGALDYVYDKVDVFDKFKIDAYLSAVGLIVRPKFRGDGVGVEILKSRCELCLAVGIKATFTIFTSLAAQAVAEKAGFQELLDISFDEIKAFNPKYDFPGIKEVSNSLKYMYIIF